MARRAGIGGVVLDASGLASSYSPAGRALPSLAGFDARARRIRCTLERRGFRVAAMVGAPEWSAPGEWPVLSAVESEIAYSAAWQRCPVRALYLDIEPWGKSPAPTHEVAIAELARTLRRTETVLRAARLRLGVFLPAWVARTVGGPALVRALQPGDVVAAMTYRARATGHHGAVAENVAFGRFLRGANPALRLLVGFETGRVPEAGISFFGSTRSRLARTAHAVGHALVHDPQLAGFFVDDLASLQRLHD